jgi:hypothetical protein
MEKIAVGVNFRILGRTIHYNLSKERLELLVEKKSQPTSANKKNQNSYEDKEIHCHQQQQLKKLGIIYLLPNLDKFNHNRSLHTPRAQGQTASQLEPPERASFFPGLSAGYVWLHSHTTVVYCEVNILSISGWSNSNCLSF